MEYANLTPLGPIIARGEFMRNVGVFYQMPKG